MACKIRPEVYTATEKNLQDCYDSYGEKSIYGSGSMEFGFSSTNLLINSYLAVYNKVTLNNYSFYSDFMNNKIDKIIKASNDVINTSFAALDIMDPKNIDYKREDYSDRVNDVIKNLLSSNDELNNVLGTSKKDIGNIFIVDMGELTSEEIGIIVDNAKTTAERNLKRAEKDF